MTLSSFGIKSSSDYSENLQKILDNCDSLEAGAIVLAPELCITGYSLEDMASAAKFSQTVTSKLLLASKNKTICLTLLIEEDGKFFNRFFAFSRSQIIYTQDKTKLFALNNEDKYFEAGKDSDINLFTINGLKVGVLICFELRFTKLWEKLKGADIILIPAMWGLARKQHFEILTQALAVANQCFVLASNSSNDDCAKSSAIITPFGNSCQNDDIEIISQKIDLNEITKMRRYLKTDII